MLVPALVLIVAAFVIVVAIFEHERWNRLLERQLDSESAQLALSFPAAQQAGQRDSWLSIWQARMPPRHCLEVANGAGEVHYRLGQCELIDDSVDARWTRNVVTGRDTGLHRFTLYAPPPGYFAVLIEVAITHLPLAIALIIAAVTLSRAWLRRWVLPPIQRLAHSLAQSQAHNLTLPVHWQSRDEIGQLVDRYNAVLAAQARQDTNTRTQMFRDIFTKHTSAMYLVDSDTLNIVDANLAAQRFYGMDRRQLLASRFTDLNLLSDTRLEALHQTVSLSREARFELRMRRPDNAIRDVEVYLSPILNEDGEGVWFVIVHDVTERHQAELALKEQTRLLAQAERLAHLGHWYYRQSDGRLTWSEETYRIHGFPADHTPTLESMIQSVHPDDRGLAARTLRSAIAEQRAFGIELRLQPTSGSVRYVWSQGHCDMVDDGRFRGVLGVLLDITERKRLEQELLEREAIWRQGAALASLGAFVSDQTLDRCVFCSQELAQIHGLTVDEYMSRYGTGSQLARAVHPDDRKRFLDTLEGRAHRGSSYQMEYRLYTVKGELRHVIERAEPLAHLSGHVVMVGSVQDITERKQMENELRERAVYDSLTGAYNRRQFLEVADREFRRSERYRRPLSLLMLDLDHFKLINDNHGHAAGDEALRQVSAVCHGVLREQDIFGRLGGEEFAILLPETLGVHGVETAERLRVRIAGLAIENADEPIRLTVSIGVALYHRGDTSVETVVQRADRALYQAKERGRNQVVFSDEADAITGKALPLNG